MKQWVLASNNAGKLSEFEHLFEQANLDVKIVSQGKLGIADATEDGLSFVENAIIKARHASRQSGLPAIADDSGLCVPILNNMPGIYSARYAGKHGDDKANNDKLIHELASLRTKEPVLGYFVCVLVFVRHGDDPLPIIAQGLWQGEILTSEQGDGGFGYDPLFFIPELNKTSAQLTKDHKNQTSHRGRAMQALLAKLSKLPH